MLAVWGPENSPDPWCGSRLLVGRHVYRVVNDRTGMRLRVSPFLPSPLQGCRVVGPQVLGSSITQVAARRCFLKEKRQWIQLTLGPILEPSQREPGVPI